MIEVEKKFQLSEGALSQLTQDAEFLHERTFTDIYYDDAQYTLTSKDMWLRSREGRFELKVPAFFSQERLVDQYEELEDESRIKEKLNFKDSEDLSQILPVHEILPFCVCTTTRRKYKKGAFIIDLDTVKFPDFTYYIGEIEMLVESQDQVVSAIKQILDFAHTYTLSILPVRGKVIEYLLRMRPDHYKALQKVGVIVE